MILEQIYLGCLSQASYLIADETTKIAVVVDPRRDIDVYLEKAAAAGLEIRHVLLTHFHADFLAGHLELRERTGATIWLGAAAEAEYAFERMADGAELELGPEVRLRFLATPGHTPESTSILVHDRASSDERPHAVLTGDTLFIGDVGRPDLMASVGMTSQELARMMYDSLNGKLLTLPDETLLYPGHGAGSMCGKALSNDTVSTIGAQRATNYALQPMSQDEFVAMITANQPEAPAYFPFDAENNKSERRTLSEVLEEAVTPLKLDAFRSAAAERAVILDTRSADAFAERSWARSVNIGLDGRFASWVGTLVEPGTPLLLITDPGKERESALRLGRIGYDNVVGHLADGLAAATGAPELRGPYRRWSPDELRERLVAPDPPRVVDVRTPGEWEAGHIESAVHAPLNRLQKELGELPRDEALVCICKGGYRSSSAASLLRAAGFLDVTDVRGGMDAWEGASPEATPACNA